MQMSIAWGHLVQKTHPSVHFLGLSAGRVGDR